MATLITGGSGFIGLALAEQLLRNGQTVVLFDRQPAPSALLDALPKGVVEQVTGDIRDVALLKSVMAQHSVDQVVHAAAITPDLQRETRDASTVLDVNINGTVALVLACTEQPSVRRVLLVSSVAVYGFAPPPGPTYREDQAWPQPTGLYGISKLASEHISLRMAELHGLDLCIARLGPVFGPWEYATGVRDMFSPHTQTLEAALNHQEACLPHSLLADWIYSRDAADALARLLTSTTLKHRLYNVGGEVQTDLPQWCGHLSERWPTWSARLAQRPEDATVRYGLPGTRPALSTERLRQDTDWSPAHSLAEAATDYLHWRSQIAAS
ncbi:NAD(P)-dependent oxidoreductase [Pseudomonas syringae]|nr:NAD(P)-dependent oxidoreductase [Pseudomonas syringae]